MPSFALVAVLLPVIVVLIAIAVFLIYVWVRYCPFVVRVFEETPVFSPLRATPERGGEEVRFRTDDGIELAGTYLRARTEGRAGVIVFCTEYLGDRWSARPYADGLREAGFDLFSFDFRNHGASDTDPNYTPLQWVSDLEMRDLQAALRYLRSRPDRDPAGVGVLGLSRGGGTALCVAADDPTIWGVVTDGAFPTRGTMMAYILRWAVIYIGLKSVWARMPHCVYSFVGWTGRITSQHRSGRRYPNVERAVRRLAPRPWLMIHGEKDAYIGPDIARALFDHAGEPKELWIVPGAKHNRCREADPEGYRRRLVEFFRRNAPRRLALSVGRPTAPPSPEATRARRAPVPAALRPDGLTTPEPVVSP